MQTPSETSRGIDYLKNIVESGTTLRMSEPRYLGQGSFLIEVTGFGKRWTMGLTTDQINDLPGTKEYRDSALSLAQTVDSRFKNLDPNLYVTNSGRLLKIDAKWPAMPLMNETGTNWIAASGLWVHLTDFLTGEVARCAVVMTTLQTMPGRGSTPFSRLAVIINSVRSSVDFGAIRFYPSSEAMGDNGERINFGFRSPESNTASTQDFLSKKVWLLGFKAGRRETLAWITDPWDASYLGCTSSQLHQEAAVLDAQGKIVLDESGEFAMVGKELLTINGPQATSRPRTEDTAQVVAEGFDVFVSHATEDKPYVEPLVRDLQAARVKVWFDRSALEWGDDLRSAIDRGLKSCRYGIVVFSKAFLRRKKWTEYELNSLFGRERVDKKVILPIWHGVTRDDLLEYGPGFADRFAMNSLTDSNVDIVRSLLRMLGRVAPSSEAADEQSKPNAIAYARYEIKGENAVRADVHIRPSARVDGWFTYEDSFGERQHGTEDLIARRFAEFDKKLQGQGYTRMNYGNLSANRAFDL